MTRVSSGRAPLVLIALLSIGFSNAIAAGPFIVEQNAVYSDSYGDQWDGDIDPFVLALTGRAAYEAACPDCDFTLADASGNAAVDLADIDPFASLLAGQ